MLTITDVNEAKKILDPVTLLITCMTVSKDGYAIVDMGDGTEIRFESLRGED